MKTLSFKVRVVPGTPYEVKFGGSITEDADFSMIGAPDHVLLNVDMAHVTLINSSGLREWRLWTSSLKNPEIKFHNCPRSFIDQLNIIPELIPIHSRVESFYVPYYSEWSDEEKMVLFRRGLDYTVEEGNAIVRWPQVKDSAGKLMAVDVLESRYFQFLPIYG